MLTSSATCKRHFVTRKCQKSKKLMEIVNIAGENLHIFWTNWGFSRDSSGKMCLMIILKVLEVTNNQGFNLALEDKFLEKPHGGAGQIDTPESFKG